MIEFPKRIVSKMPYSKEKYNRSLFYRYENTLNVFLSIANSRKGYANKNVTPYMHAAAYHSQDVTDRFGSVKHFSSQGTVRVTDYSHVEQTKCMPKVVLCIAKEFLKAKLFRN